MSFEILHHPALRELRQLVAELSLISHVSGTSYEGKVARDTSESKGGGRPPGGEGEHKPRAPQSPRVEDDAASQKSWDEYELELAAWLVCYHRRTPNYFALRLERCGTERGLLALRDEARETLEAWRRTPIPMGQPPEVRHPQWKRYVAESVEDAGELARRFDCTRRYINRIRQQYRAAA